MALRRQLADQHAIYADPTRGVNLRSSEEDLEAGEARLMQNCLFDGGTRIRTGSTRVNSASLGAFRIRGGTKFYRANTTSQRLIAYGTNISALSDAGVETNLTAGMTSDRDTHFTTWSITDSCYVANNTDVLRVINNAGVLSTLTGTAIPSPLMVAPIRDRLMGITSNGIERTDPRNDTIWSNNSSWATLRPAQSGLFTALHPYSFESAADASGIVSALLAFQANAFYLVTGTNFGSDVTSVTQPTGEDSSIVIRDSRVGTSSPYSITTVPGVGTFWFTSDLNVYWLPSNAPSGRFVADRIVSNSSTTGINNTNLNALGQVWMTYFDRKLILAIPVGSDTYPTVQFWMDMRSFVERPERGPVWYGPMTGQSVGRAWVEGQTGDNKLVGGEGNSATGAFVYNLLQSGTYTDAVGTADNNVSMVYQTYFKSFGRAEREKYVRSVQFDLNAFTGTATADLLDLTGAIASGVAISAV